MPSASRGRSCALFCSARFGHGCVPSKHVPYEPDKASTYHRRGSGYVLLRLCRPCRGCACGAWLAGHMSAAHVVAATGRFVATVASPCYRLACRARRDRRAPDITDPLPSRVLCDSDPSGASLGTLGQACQVGAVVYSCLSGCVKTTSYGFTAVIC